MDPWYSTEWAPVPASMFERSRTYPVVPDSSELRTSTALAKAWCCAADSRPARRKWRVVKYDSPPMRIESSQRPEPEECRDAGADAQLHVRAPACSPCP